MKSFLNDLHGFRDRSPRDRVIGIEIERKDYQHRVLGLNNRLDFFYAFLHEIYIYTHRTFTFIQVCEPISYRENLVYTFVSWIEIRWRKGRSGERILKRCSGTRAQGAAFTELSRSGGRASGRVGSRLVRVLKRARIFNKARLHCTSLRTRSNTTI